MSTTREELRKAQEAEKKMARYKALYLEQVKEAKRVSTSVPQPSSNAMTSTGLVPNPRAERVAARNQEQVDQDEEMARRLMQGDLLQRFESEVKVLKDAATANKEQLAEYKIEMDTLKKLYDDASQVSCALSRIVMGQRRG